MKQFPYAQQIIWENDVEQIEWTEEFVGIWDSGQYVAKEANGYLVVGNWRCSDDEEKSVEFITSSGWNIEIDKLLCWVKL